MLSYLKEVYYHENEHANDHEIVCPVVVDCHVKAWVYNVATTNE